MKTALYIRPSASNSYQCQKPGSLIKAALGLSCIQNDDWLEKNIKSPSEEEKCLEGLLSKIAYVHLVY